MLLCKQDVHLWLLPLVVGLIHVDVLCHESVASAVFR